jgi:hypothetical protein
MQDKLLLSITVVTDDSTGIYTVGELDFGIHGRLDEYLDTDTRNRRDEILKMLGFLAYKVCEKSEKILQANDVGQTKDSIPKQSRGGVDASFI